jgi:4-amino-4-deoxy-L-arabinose transferase-like glycosyltransferase
MRWVPSRVLSSLQILVLIIALGVAARLYRLGGPFSDWHGYRQFDTAAIARNLAEDSLNIFYPQVDWRGNSPGYVEVEFQAFTLMVAALYRVFGVHEWLARVLNLFFYAGTTILLYRLTCKVFNRRTALFTAGFYSFLPLSYSVSHNFQPDTFMVLATIAGIYYFWMWTEDGRSRWLAISVLGLAMAVLIKPFCLYVGVPLIYLAWRKFGWRFLAKPVLWIYALLVIVPMIGWYTHAFRVWTVYGNTFGIFGGRVRGIYLGGDIPSTATLLHNLGWRLLWEIATPPGLLLLIAGFFVRPPSRNWIFHWWALAFLATVPMLPAGHSGHNYYQLPLVLIVAPAMAYGLVRLMDRGVLSWRMAGMACLLIFAFCLWGIRPMIASGLESQQRLAFGKRVAQVAPEDALIVISYPTNYRPSWYSHRTLDGDLIAGDPTDFYNSHRKGWSLFAWQTSPEMLRKLQKHHAQYFATFYPKYLYEQSPEIKGFLETNAIPVEVTGRWIIYRLPMPDTSSASPGDPPATAEHAHS